MEVQVEFSESESLFTMVISSNKIKSGILGSWREKKDSENKVVALRE